MIRLLGEARLIGGLVYDALVARAAVKSGAQEILTLNGRDFDRLGSVFGVKVRTP